MDRSLDDTNNTDAASDTDLPWPNSTLIAGPTASGKSALALKIAQQRDGVIINTDSMQVYSVLRVLTARPDQADLELVPHLLYGHVNPTTPYSTGHWIKDVKAALASLEADRHAVFVGGTGLYFKALLGGLSPMPEIPNSVRDRWRYRLDEEGASKLYQILRAEDADAAMVLNAADGQRIVRALEVLEVTGKSIVRWQGKKNQPVVNPVTADRYVLQPDREILRERIHARFDQMIKFGAVEEVRALKALLVDDSMTIKKAIGVPQLSDFIDGILDVDQAIELSKIATRQYAKRQMTWFRNQLDEHWQRIEN